MIYFLQHANDSSTAVIITYLDIYDSVYKALGVGTNSYLREIEW